MPIIRFAAAVTLTILALLPAQAAQADTWKPHINKELGVTLLAPRGVKFENKQWDGGWKGVHAAAGEATLTIAMLPGKKIPALFIREQAEKISAMERDHWTVVRTHKAKRGWIWYCTAKAVKGDRAALAVYGIGPKNTTYLMLITTTKKGAKKQRKLFKRWSRTIAVK